jgi:hypothetical protein
MKKIISNLDYNIMKNKISPLDEGVVALKPKRTRKTKHTFKLSDIKKGDVKQTGFTTKQQSLKFLTNILDKKYTDFKTKDELITYIKIKKDNLDKHLDVSGYGKKKRMTKKEMTFFKNVKELESKLTKYEERRPKKYHITAEIKRGITFTKANGKKYKYDSQYQHGKLKTKDILLDSRIIEARSEQDAKNIMIAEIEEAFAMDEYSGAAAYNIDDVNFIDTVNESSLMQQPTANMPMKYSKHVDYSFTNEDKQFLDTESDGTCVIDNFIGMYGEELKLTREGFLKLHENYYDSIDLWKQGITPEFLEFICKFYDISHYAYDINNECFMKYISKNQNHKALIYYSINNHMYLVKEEFKKSSVEKAKEEHNINTSLLEGYEKENVFNELSIIENLDFNEVDKYDCCLVSR